MDVRFVIVAPASARKSFRVRLPVVVGRGDEAKLRIQQDSVSRRHCEFTHDGVAVAVTDLGSTNGTIVAGTRIAAHAATAVPSGAEVRIGNIVLRVEYAASKRGAPAAAPAAAAPHEADTVPLLAAATAELAELEALPELEPVGETTAGEQAAAGSEAAAADGPTLADAPAFPDVVSTATTSSDPAFPDVEPAAPPAEVPAFPDLDPALPPADESFDFLAGAPAPPPADDSLDDFFKSLS